MKTGITLSDLRRAVDVMKKNKVPQNVVKTKKEAARMNKANRAMGLTHRWNVGDTYYNAMVHPYWLS